MHTKLHTHAAIPHPTTNAHPSTNTHPSPHAPRLGSLPRLPQPEPSPPQRGLFHWRRTVGCCQCPVKQPIRAHTPRWRPRVPLKHNHTHQHALPNMSRLGTTPSDALLRPPPPVPMAMHTPQTHTCTQSSTLARCAPNHATRVKPNTSSHHNRHAPSLGSLPRQPPPGPSPPPRGHPNWLRTVGCNH